MLMLDHHRRRRHLAFEAIIAAPVAISRDRNFFPVALDDIHLAVDSPAHLKTTVCAGARSARPTSRLAAEAATA